MNDDVSDWNLCGRTLFVMRATTQETKSQNGVWDAPLKGMDRQHDKSQPKAARSGTRAKELLHANAFNLGPKQLKIYNSAQYHMRSIDVAVSSNERQMPSSTGVE